MLHPDNHAAQIVNRADMRGCLGVADQALAGSDIGCAEGRHTFASRRDRRAGGDAVEGAVRKPGEDAIEIAAGVGNEPPLQAELRRDRLHQLDIKAARRVAVHELERRVRQGGPDAKDSGNNGGDAHMASASKPAASSA